jgi:ankyrin repeat protein
MNERLIDAIKTNDTATASSLISSSSVNLNGKWLPLHHATRLGRVEIMTMLLDAGADIDAVDEYQHTSCHVAIMINQFDALKLLVERGATVGVLDADGDSLLSIVAQFCKNEQIVTFLIDAGASLDGLSSFQLMKLVKSVAVFDRLMARGVNLIPMRDQYHDSTLCHHVARNVTREDDLRFFVNACGNDAVHAVDERGCAPLHWASKNNNDSAVRVLVEFGADIDHRDTLGLTALIDAICSQARISHVEMLLALGADVSLAERWGETACHFAARLRRRDFLCALVAGVGDLDQLGRNGETPRTIITRNYYQSPTTVEINAARHRITKMRLDLVRERAFQICVGLQSFRLNALQLCEILMHSFGALGSLILFHQWWAIAVKVKHFQ